MIAQNTLLRTLMSIGFIPLNSYTDNRLANRDAQIDRWIILLDLLMIMINVIQNAFGVLHHLILEIRHTVELPTMTMVHLPAITIVPFQVQVITVVNSVVQNEVVLTVDTF